ncbi:MAG: hypothetical protein QF486_00795 [Candidatus Woesearchaeota archaeon]|jgi:hypothetical protein|nr:hypothetical protein [Candidatus Woesearchaeota archaeon]MDP7181242.1 hypothetical protein [Candidatus Woesearchaeota archaeon]MDP7198139.1 hypothetical protein [Candidatus Woesearchaeota archaeon]MDP7466973.1 hypothetical protein [Candidatus Woesearchaeota archaeon]MDP7646941.1 hypothetical protein [Candidatus Woesearchaeota archaeon]
MSLSNPSKARQFLTDHDYRLTEGNDNPRDMNRQVTFRTGTGDSAWHGDWETPGAGTENNYTRMEGCVVCPTNKTESNYCKDCGVGVNGNETWSHKYTTYGDDQLREALTMENIMGA